MKNSLFSILLLFISTTCFSQEGFEKWNEHYIKINFTDLMRYEKAYADSVDRGIIEGKYYSRYDRYQIKAECLGEERVIADSIILSMKNVNKLFGEREFLPVITSIKKEYLFRIEGIDYWIAIQNVLEKPFQDEIMPHDSVILYCMYFNEHRWNKALYNTFLISEFRRE